VDSLLEWEGIIWARVGPVPPVNGILIRCDGCDRRYPTVVQYAAHDPEDAPIRAYWCWDCIQHASAYQKPQETCAWCDLVMNPGTLPATHGICPACAVSFKAEAQAVVNPHLDTEDREQQDELLPARPSDEFASRQTPDGGW
jgi:hypothetical protein